MSGSGNIITPEELLSVRARNREDQLRIVLAGKEAEIAALRKQCNDDLEIFVLHESEITRLTRDIDSYEKNIKALTTEKNILQSEKDKLQSKLTTQNGKEEQTARQLARLTRAVRYWRIVSAAVLLLVTGALIIASKGGHL